jgi:ABC-2 type transport system ATP-binding protein
MRRRLDLAASLIGYPEMLVLDEADQLASRIAVIDGGKVIAEGTPAELKASVGGQRLLVTLAPEADPSTAAAALAPS